MNSHFLHVFTARASSCVLCYISVLVTLPVSPICLKTRKFQNWSYHLLLSDFRNYFRSLQSLSPACFDERKQFSMVVSSKLGRNGNFLFVMLLFRTSYSLNYNVCFMLSYEVYLEHTAALAGQTYEALRNLNQYHAEKSSNYGSLLPSAGNRMQLNSNRVLKTQLTFR